MKRKVAIAAAVALASAVLVAVALRAILPAYRAAENGRRLREELAARAAKVSPQWRIDVDAVRADRVLWDVLQPQMRNADASAFFAARLSAIPARDHAPAHPLPRIPDHVERHLVGDDFLANADEIEFDDVDTSWMNGLRWFSHWDIEAAAVAMGAAPDDSFMTIPKHGTLELHRWGRLRLAEGLINDEMDDASADVRALARLLWSTDGMIDAVMAAMLLDDDAKARALARELGASLALREIETAPRLEKVVRSSFALYGVATPPTLHAYEESDVMFCAAIAEGAATFLLGRSLFAPAYQDREVAIGRAIEKSPCALTRIRRHWREGGGEMDLGELEGMRSWMRDTILATTTAQVGGYFAD